MSGNNAVHVSPVPVYVFRRHVVFRHPMLVLMICLNFRVRRCIANWFSVPRHQPSVGLIPISRNLTWRMAKWRDSLMILVIRFLKWVRMIVSSWSRHLGCFNGMLVGY